MVTSSMVPGMGMRASAPIFTHPPLPLGGQGGDPSLQTPFFNFNPPTSGLSGMPSEEGLSLNTQLLPDELDPFHFRTSGEGFRNSGDSAALGIGLGLGLTPTADSRSIPSGNIQMQGQIHQGQTQTRAPGQNFGKKFRTQSLEWLEDALLSPSQAQAQALQAGSGQARNPSGRVKPAKLITHTSRDSGSLSLGLGFTPSALGGLLTTGLTPTGFMGTGLTPTGLTPTDAKADQAKVVNAGSKSMPVRKQSSIKDEDLDHFLMDMDLEQLGQGIEERLSFTVDE